MSEIQTVFSGDYIDRCGELRTQIDRLEEAYHDPATRFLPVWRNRISPRMSIAYRLIETWFDAGPGPRLASLEFQ